MNRSIAILLVWLTFALSLPAQVMQQAVMHSAPPGGIWTLAQHPHNFTCLASATGSTQTLACTVTSTATTAGNLLILASSFAAGATSVAPTFSSASGDSAWTHCPSAYAKQLTSTNGYMAVDCAYILSATGGATTETFTWTVTATSAHIYSSVELLEVHKAIGSAVFDACTSGSGCVTTAAGTATRTSPSCPMTGASEYVAQWIADSENIVSISGAAYINPIDLDNSNVEAGFAGALNQSTAPAQTWTVSGETSTDGAAMATVCFK